MLKLDLNGLNRRIGAFKWAPELTRLTSSKVQPLDQRQAQVIWGQGFIYLRFLKATEGTPVTEFKDAKEVADWLNDPDED